ncbi:MAG: PaaI family thioesterase [Gammaproteobacteria bacterium]
MSNPNPRAVRILDQIVAGDVPYPGMWSTVPVRLLEYGYGRIRLSARADERHLNAFGGVHGGFAAAVLDTALGLTVFVSLDEESARHTTTELAVKCLKAMPAGRELFVETRLVHLSRRMGVSEAEMVDATGTAYAHGTTTCLIKRAEP